jgi:hypothetical protein
VVLHELQVYIDHADEWRIALEGMLDYAEEAAKKYLDLRAPQSPTVEAPAASARRGGKIDPFAYLRPGDGPEVASGRYRWGKFARDNNTDRIMGHCRKRETPSGLAIFAGIGMF